VLVVERYFDLGGLGELGDRCGKRYRASGLRAFCARNHKMFVRLRGLKPIPSIDQERHGLIVLCCAPKKMHLFNPATRTAPAKPQSQAQQSMIQIAIAKRQVQETLV